MSGFTEKEKQIIEKLVDVHNLYCELESQHPSDITEWVGSLHQMQQLMGMRILRREHPEIFPTKE
jgi:hypothetical protein